MNFHGAALYVFKMFRHQQQRNHSCKEGEKIERQYYHQEGLADSNYNDTLTTSNSESRNPKVIKGITL
jgi:hypothetical protein